jgi:hypothetical protein
MSKLEETMAAIGRIRRAMPRNVDAMLICDELEKRMTQMALPLKGQDGVHRYGENVTTEIVRSERAAGKVVGRPAKKAKRK